MAEELTASRMKTLEIYRAFLAALEDADESHRWLHSAELTGGNPRRTVTVDRWHIEVSVGSIYEALYADAEEERQNLRMSLCDHPGVASIDRYRVGGFMLTTDEMVLL